MGSSRAGVSFPGAEAALARYAALAAEDDRALEAIAVRLLGEGVDPGGRLAAAPVRAQSVAIQRRVVRRWLDGAYGLSSFSAERTDAVLPLAQLRSRGKRDRDWRGLDGSPRARDAARRADGEPERGEPMGGEEPRAPGVARMLIR